MIAKMLNPKLFQGTISNCNKEVLSSVSGRTDAFNKVSVSTSHSHYTTFDIGNATFLCGGAYPFRDGDKVVLYAWGIGGYYKVGILKNFTRNYFIQYTAMGSREIMSSFTLSGIMGMGVGSITEVPELGISGGLATSFLCYRYVRKVRKSCCF